MSVVQRHEGAFVDIRMSPEAALVLDGFVREQALRTRFTGTAGAALHEAVRAVNDVAADIVAERQRSSGATSGHDGARPSPSVPRSTPPAIDEPAWITVQEAAQRSGWSERHVRRQAQVGHLRAERGPTGWRIDSMDAAVRGARPA